MHIAAMIEKKELKKIIKRRGKEENLYWGKDGEQYILTDGYFALKAKENIFNNEIIGLLYKYFGKIPEEGNVLKTLGDTSINIDNTKKVFKIMNKNLEIKNNYPAYCFSNVYISLEYKKQAVLYRALLKKDITKVVAIDTTYQNLIILPQIAPHLCAYNTLTKALIFHDCEKTPVLSVMPLRLGKKDIPSILNPYFQYTEEEDLEQA